MRRQTIRKAVFVIAAISFLVMGSRALQFNNITHSLGGWSSDHFSHWGSSILFTRVGFDSYRLPSKITCPITDSPEIREELKRSPLIDFCMTPGQPQGSRPLAINWPQYPQPYPPGLLLFSAPAGALYDSGVLSFHQTNTFTILQYLFFSLLCWVIYSCFLIDIHPRSLGIPLALALSVTMYMELSHWALSGFYDGIAVLMVGLAIYFLSVKQNWKSIFFYSTALFLHFRALWFLSVLGLALKSAIQEKRYPTGWSEKTLTLLSVLMLGTSGFAFFLLYPSLKAYPVSNPQYWSAVLHNPRTHLPFMAAWAGVAGYLVYERAWSVFGIFCWALFFMGSTPEIRPWHAVFLLPFFVVPLVARREIKAGTTLALFAFYWIARGTVFGL